MKYQSPPELKRICVLMKLYCSCSQQELTGLKDTDFKLWACYLATKTTTLTIGQIANYFNIYPKYMRNRLETMAAHYYYTSSTAPQTIETLAKAYRELEQLQDA